MVEPRPRARHDLEAVSAVSAAGASEHLLFDPERGEGFALGALEWAIWRLCDGSRSVERIREEVASELGRPLAVEDLVSFLHQLERQGLLVASGPAGSDAGRELPVRRGTIGRVLSLPLRLVLRLLLVVPGDLVARFLEHLRSFAQPRRWVIARPDRALYWLYRRLRWVFSGGFVALAMVVIVTGSVVAVLRWEAFWGSNWMIWQAENLLRLALVGVLCVHVPHQLAHGLVCIHFHGRVRECGIRLILNVLPSFYCDVADARWITDKGRRLWVIVAGLFYQLLAFAVGIIGWTLTRPLQSANAFWATVAATAFWGLVLNANPVIKRDMYYLITGWLETPQLRERSRELLKAWVRWRVPPEALSGRRRLGFAGYALASNLVGVVAVTLAGLFWVRLAGAYHEKAGMGLLAVSAIFLQSRIASAVAVSRRSLGVHVHTALKAVLWIVAAAALIVVLLLPYPYEASGEVTLLPGQRFEIRSEVEGRVAAVLVEEGEWVEEGQQVVRLVDRVYDRNLNAAQAQLEGARARLRLLLAGSTVEEVLKARKQVETAQAKYEWSRARAERHKGLYEKGVISSQELENAIQVNAIDLKELEEKQAQLAIVRRSAREEAVSGLEAEIRSLEVVVGGYRRDVEETILVSPISGRVVTPRVKELAGSYVKPGQTELVIEVEDTRVIRAEVHVQQEDIAGVELGCPVRVVVWAYPDLTFQGEVVAIAPVATETSDAALGEAHLTVGGSQDLAVRVTTEIPNPDGALKSEMSGYGKIATGHRQVWDVLLRPLIRWFQVEVWSWIP
jgi:multidrug resistance efflux pump